jgi:hypothetical protein
MICSPVLMGIVPEKVEGHHKNSIVKTGNSEGL